MRICIVYADSVNETGGMQWSVKRIALLMREAGCEVDLVQLLPVLEDTLWRSRTEVLSRTEDLAPGVSVYRLTPWLCRPGTSYAQREICAGLERLDDSRDYDVFHCFGFGQVAHMAGVSAASRGKPFIASARGSDVNLGVYRHRFFPYVQWLNEHADIVTFVSEAMRKKVAAVGGTAKHSRVIYNSTDPSFFDPVPNRQRHQDVPVIGGAGVLSVKKGADVISMVLRALHGSGRGVHFEWTGGIARDDLERGRYSHDLLTLIDEGRVASHIAAVPHREMLICLANLDIYLQASPDEGCSNALLEAMLAKRPIVATGVGATPEIMRDGKDGILVRPYDIEAMAEAVRRLLDDALLRQRLGESAYERVRGFCTSAKEREAWIDCYQHAVQSGRRER